MKSTQTERQNGQITPFASDDRPGFPLDLPAKENKLSGLDHATCDDVSLRLSGLIGIFEMLVNASSGQRNNEKRTLLDFSFYVSSELRDLYKKIARIDYFE